MNTIVCPKCKKEFEISEAISHEVAEGILAKNNVKHQEEMEKLRREADEKAQLKIKEFEKKRELSDRETKEREEKIKSEADKSASEKYRFDKLAYEKRIADMQKHMDDAQRKGRQGSQELQGEIPELDLEQKLKMTFIYDQFKPVPKGIRGGDIVHEIRNKFGNVAGSILWETKKQQAWSKSWLTKLKEDMRRVDASDCILVTDVLPTNIKNYDRIENVWVTCYENAIKLATVLRFGILNLAIARSSASQSDEQLKNLYKIITSDSFRHMFEAREEIVTNLKKELDLEISSTETRWRKRKENIDKLSRNNNQLYGELQTHIPSLKPLGSGDSLGLGDGKD